MPRKMVGYIFLSLFSFCFFTIVFNIIAVAQVSAAAQSSPQNPPIPTIYEQQNETAPKQTTQVVYVSTPTPTIFATQQLNGSIKQTGETVQPTATPIPPTATPTPSPLPTATPTPQPTITTTTDLETLFGKYSSQYSVSEDELKKIANCESGFNSSSDTGIYAGMYQFSSGTWASVRGLMGMDTNPDLRKNADEAIKTAAFMLARGEQNAWPNCH